MATIKRVETTESQVELTPDYCFGEAARALAGSLLRDNAAEVAREWRALGEAIRAGQAPTA